MEILSRVDVGGWGGGLNDFKFRTFISGRQCGSEKG